MQKLRIAQIILPWIPLPPERYGGTERIVYTLTEELVKRGHEVTLFATGDSKTSAKLDFIFPESLGLQENVKETLTTTFNPLRHVAYAFSKAGEFDVIHSHAQYLGLPFASLVATPTIHTFHRVYQGTDDEVGLLQQFKHQNFVSISDSQRDLGLNFIATVYNGIPVEEYEYSDKIGDYLFWSGRILPKKGIIESIEIAKKFGIKLKVAGVVTDGDFFEKNINPHIDGEHVEYLGELSQKEMGELYKGAYATLFPISWREPFGLVMAESMAVGTPIVAFKWGAVPEVIEEGKTGFIVSHIDEAVTALKNIPSLSRTDCRKRVEERFSVQKMTDGYEKVYRQILSHK
jgi:glycosyltransferase involved in cell wall biosynthesis